MKDAMHIDEFDRKLLAALAAKGDITNQQLATRVGLSESQCYRRRQRLEEQGAIRGYRAVIDYSAFGMVIGAYVHLSMVSQSTHQRKEFAAFVKAQPGVLSCHAVTGDADYILHVRTKDLSELNKFVNALLAHGKDRLHTRSLVILETIIDSA
jgi:DNA-binding Lrp family transcriptional regulator